MNFKHLIKESRSGGADNVLVTDQGDHIGLCITSGENVADLLLTGAEAYDLAEALKVACFLLEVKAR